MAHIDVKRRGTVIPTGFIVPVTASLTGTRTAAFTACLPVMPPFELYKIRGFDVEWVTSSTCTEQNSIEVGMMAMASSGNIETSTILFASSTTSAWAITTCSSIGSAAYTLYGFRARNRAQSDANAQPYNTAGARSFTYILPNGQGTATATSAGTVGTSTAYDFKIGAGGDAFSVLTSDNRVKTGTRLGYVPAVRVTQAAKTDCFQNVKFTVYFEGASLLNNPQP